MITLHTLKPSSRRSKTKRLGRGNASGKGTTAGRGTKGQRARTGGRNKLLRRSLKRLVERTPKVRGFQSRRNAPLAVTVDQLERHFKDGATVNAQALRQAGLIPTTKSSFKILGGGSVKKKLTLDVRRISKSAAEQITAAGGTVMTPKPKTDSSS